MPRQLTANAPGIFRGFPNLDFLMTALPLSLVRSYRAVLSAGLITLVCLAGCASTKPVDYQQLSSASELVPSARGGNQFEYDDAAGNLKSYDNVEIDPITIYSGSDAQFGKVTTDDREAIAAYMQEQFSKELATQVQIVTAAGAHTARVHLTLTGLETSTPVLSTLSHVLPFGIVVNAGKQATGHNGSFLGSVSYAVEIYDAQSGDLVYASIAKRYPKALDVTSSVGTLDAAKTGVREGAKALTTRLASAKPVRSVRAN